MKFTLALAVVLAAVAAVCHSSAIKASSRSNLSVGYVATGDRLLHEAYVNHAPSTSAVQYEDVVYNGNATIKISTVQASEVGVTERAAAWIAAGGIGCNNVTVRFHSNGGTGFNYLLQIWGH